MANIAQPLFVIVSGPRTDMLFRAFVNFQRHEEPLTVVFVVMPNRYPGVALTSSLQITDLRWLHVPLANEVSARFAESVITIPSYDLKANMTLPDSAIKIFDGRTRMQVHGEFFPETYPPETGRGWFNEDA